MNADLHGCRGKWSTSATWSAGSRPRGSPRALPTSTAPPVPCLSEGCGLDDSHRFHDLRHTFGTRAAGAGVPMRTLQEWMGHRNLTTTQIYADYSPNAAESEMVARAFGR